MRDFTSSSWFDAWARGVEKLARSMEFAGEAMVRMSAVLRAIAKARHSRREMNRALLHMRKPKRGLRRLSGQLRKRKTA